MRKYLFVIFLFFCFTPVTYATEYHCEYTEGDTFFSETYDPQQTAEEDCSWLKSFGEKKYTDCLNRQVSVQRAYQEGKCEQIIVKNHRIDNSDCKVSIGSKSKRILGYSCLGGNTSSAMEKLKQKYK